MRGPHDDGPAPGGGATPEDATRTVATTCPYCGVGCGLTAEVSGDRLLRVAGDPEHPVNRGATCRKPLHLPEAVRAPDRAITPLLRERTDVRWRPASWEEATDDLAGRLRRIVEEHGPDAVAFYVSGQLLTEDYYVAGKLVKGFLGTNNLDSNSRLCMSSAVAGHVAAFGSDGPPACYDDLDRTDCILLLGSNTAACHPILWTRIRQRQRQGATVIVVDPRRTGSAQAADLHLPVRPGTDLPLLAAMIGELDHLGHLDREMLAARAEGLDELLAEAARWPLDRAAETCGVDAAQIAEAARRFGEAPRAMTAWSMGANQSRVGTKKNQALIALCVATGNLGRPGCGPLSLTGQPNAMGGRESGGLAPLLPGYRQAASAEHRAEMRRLWDVPAELPGLSALPGLAATELTEALEDGRVRALWVLATNPVVSQPDARRFQAALRRAELVVVQDAHHPTETAQFAHAVLPAAAWPEKEGVMTNSERRVSRVRRAIAPPGAARPDWEILAGVGRALGWGEHFAWRSAAEVHAEYVGVTAGRPCDQSGVSHARLDAEGTLQWPVPAHGAAGDAHPGTPRLYRSGPVPTPSGRVRLGAPEHEPLADPPDAAHPIVLSTGRVASHWHTMSRTGKSTELLGADHEPFVQVHRDDAATAGLRDGDLVRIVGRRGEMVARARVGVEVPTGVAFAPFHWGALHAPPGAGHVNELTPAALDPVSKQPELKACAVRLEPWTPGRPARAAHVRRRLLVVGTGMAAQHAVEAALAHVGPEAWAVTMVGREPDAPYDRVALSQVLAGDRTDDDVALRPGDWFTERGVDLRTGTEVAALDPAARTAVLRRGGEDETVEWDRLLLATGSRSFRPPVVGLDGEGVVAFRTLADVRALRAATGGGVRAVVLGGGLLGLEAARGLRSRGLRTTVVHLAPRLMERQLDDLASGLVQRGMRALGVESVTGTMSREVVRDEHGRLRALALADGREIPCDLLVVACGITPEVELARAAGVEVSRGIVVDDEMRTSTPGVWAVGECAEHRGTVYGLWPPLREQARTAGASLADRPGGFHGAAAATTLKVSGLDVFTAGRTAAATGDDEVVALDTRAGRYRRLLLRDGRLEGAILVGDLGEVARLRGLLRTGEPVPEALLAAGAAAEGPADDELVCSCHGVRRSQIAACVRSGAGDVGAVAARTQASTGCGSCRTRVGQLVAEHAPGATTAAPTPAAA